MTATLINALVDRWLIYVEALKTVFDDYSEVYNVKERTAKLLHVAVVTWWAASITFVVPSYIFSKLEGWTYFESFYFCFISMTTVGLGDYVIANSRYWRQHNYRIVYKIFIVVFFIVGLSFVILILELSGKVPETPPSLLFTCEGKVKQINNTWNARAQHVQKDQQNVNRRNCCCTCGQLKTNIVRGIESGLQTALISKCTSTTNSRHLDTSINTEYPDK